MTSRKLCGLLFSVVFLGTVSDAKPQQGGCPKPWRSLKYCDRKGNECNSDAECPRKDMKCCHNGCEKECVRPGREIIRRPYSLCFVKKSTGMITCHCKGPCTFIKDPVCGTDGKTYINRCVLQRTACKRNKSITVKKKEKCDIKLEESGCPKPWRSMKSCDRKGNECNGDEECQQDRKCCHNGCQKQCVRPGREIIRRPYSRCFVKKSTGMVTCHCKGPCTFIRDPVCGTDEKTYINRCVLQRTACKRNESITVKRKEKCDIKREESGCPKPWRSMKSCDRKGNECNGDEECQQDRKCCHNGCQKQCVRPGRANEYVQRQKVLCGLRHCPPHHACVKMNKVARCVCKKCIPNGDPVCGNDGKTYNNLCEMIKTACRTNITLQRTSWASCKAPITGQRKTEKRGSRLTLLITCVITVSATAIIVQVALVCYRRKKKT